MPEQEPIQRNNRLVVGLGASAGGLEAFKAFFSNMPADTGMSFVVVQHLSPAYKSVLVELVRNCTSMPVEEAANGTTVAPDHVYVIPPDATLTIEKGVLQIVKPAPPREHRHPIDTFFTSLAEDQGENAVCIILSGAGSDGSAGLRRIKEHDGFSLAQAEFDDVALAGMPQSAASTGLIDFVLPADQMPAKLMQYKKHLEDVGERKGADGSRSDISEKLGDICAVLRQHLGHDFAQYKTKTLARRVQRRMQLLQIDEVSAYINRLNREARERDLLAHDFLIGVTEFFRDPAAFNALAENVIPKLLEGKGADDLIRIWVAGCATGEEAYSLAILLKEATTGRTAVPRIQIFATDLDEQAITLARAGHYRSSIAANITPERLERWFVKEGQEFPIAKAIRELCVFSVHDILRDPPFSKLDLISCRNLMIYLDAPAQARLLKALHYALRPGGYLFLGTSETIGRQTELFNVVDKKSRIFQRSDVAGVLPLPLPTRRASITDAPLITTRGDVNIDRVTARVVGKYAPAYIVIDQGDRIIRFFGQTSKYLEPAPGAASLDFNHMLRQELRGPLRQAIQEVRRTHLVASQENLVVPVNGGTDFVSLRVEPLPDLPADGMSRMCVVLFQEQRTSPEATTSSTGPVETADVSKLQRELDALRQQLNSTVSELELSNEELKSSNEEFQSINEELQSTNEELETAKEELQSVNEELQTVNTELSSRNEALSRANSDLKNFLDSTEIAMLFLDADLRIRTYTPAMTGLLRLREGDRGRPVTDLVTRLAYTELVDDARKVLRDLLTLEREVHIPEHDGPVFILRIRPYRSVDNVIDGVVMTFMDITSRKHAEEKGKH